MKIGYLRQTQFYIILICFITLMNGLIIHYSYQETLHDMQYQKLSHAYQHQLKSLQDAIIERSTLYKQYIINRKSKITLNDLQGMEQKIKIILSRLTNASSGMLWETPLKKLADLNQQFSHGASELVQLSSRASKTDKTSLHLMEEPQLFAEKIDHLDILLKNYITQLSQIAEQADHQSDQEIYKQRQFFIFVNLLSCLIIVGLLLYIYFSIGYKLRRSIINLTHALKDYRLFGVSIPTFRNDRESEMGHLIAAAQSFRDHLIENVIIHIRESHPVLFKEVEHIIVTSKDLKKTANEILDIYDNSDLKTKDILQANEQTRNSLRTIIKNGENFLNAAAELNLVGKSKKIAPHIKNLELLVEQAHKAIVKEQNSAKKIVTLAKMEAKQKKIFELLLELSVKMGYVAEQLEKELSNFIHSSSIHEENIVINRR